MKPEVLLNQTRKDIMSKGIYRTMHLKNIDTNKLIKIIGEKIIIHKNKITRQNGVFLKNTFWFNT